jgi:hypothetical protein
MDALGHEVNSAGFWCVVGLFWAADMLGRIDGYNDATELAQATWAAAKDMLEQAKGLQRAKGYDNDAQ